MATESPFCLVTPRDRDLFRALDRSPLTVRQLLKLSPTFAYPFTAERRVQERLQRLRAAGRVRRWPYATAGQGALSYYTLSPLGYRLLHGESATSAGRRFGPVSVAMQAHTQALAEAIVHVLVAAREAGVAVEEFHRENALRLAVGEDSLYPDASFVLQPQDDDRRLSYFIEIDNRTESVRSQRTTDSWEKKVQFYERYQDSRLDRFRVLTITTGGPERLRHMLACAAEVARNPERSLVYGVTLSNFLAAEDPLAGPCFRNHHMDAVPLIPAQRQIPLTSDKPPLSFSACLRTLAEV